MKSLPSVIVWIGALTVFTLAGNRGKLQFGGYLENRTSISIAPDEIVSDIAQARLEGTWNYGKIGGVETHVLLTAPLQPLDPFETMRKSSITSILLQELLSPFIETLGEFQSSADTANHSIPLSQKNIDRFVKYLPYSTFYPSDKVILDRALIKAYFRHFDLFIGRQMIAWGTGYAFNPTDVWNSKNPLDPDAPKTGVNALRMEIPMGDLSRISLVVSPGRDLKNSSGGIRYKTNIARFDLSLSGIRLMNADRKLLGLPPRIIIGADLAGQIGDAGVWAEAALKNPHYNGIKYTNFDSCYLQADVGLDYTFTNGVYVMAEYCYNQPGQKKSSDYNAADLLYIFAGEMSGFARHYLFAGMRYEVTSRLSYSVFTLGNMADQSVMLLPAAQYRLSDDICFELGAQIGIGHRKKSEYGGVYPNCFLKVSGYF